MVGGIFAIAFGVVLLTIASRWAENMANNFRKLDSEIDPAIFKIAMWIAGLAGIVFGIVMVTSALR